MLPGRWQRQRTTPFGFPLRLFLLGVQVRECKRTAFGVQIMKCLMIVKFLQQARQPTIPHPALKCGNIDASQVLTDQRQSTLEIRRVVDQVGNDATAMRAIENRFAFIPLPPVGSKDLFLFLFSRTVMRIGFCECKVQRPFVIRFAPMQADPFSGFTK